MITVAVLVVGLVLGAAAVVGLRLLRKDSATGPAIPSDDWARGAHRAWTLDTGDDPDSGVTIAGDDDQLIVANFINRDPHSDRMEIEVTRVRAYDVSGDEPEEQWSTDLNVHYQTDPSHPKTIYSPFYWGGRIVIGDKFLGVDDGEVSEAPWNAFPTLIDDYAIECDEKDHCSAWSAEDLNRKLWETDVPDSFDYLYYIHFGNEFFRGVYEGDRTIAFVSPSIAVDVATGEHHDFHIDYRRTGDPDIPFHNDYYVSALADGWLRFDTNNDPLTILSPTGEEVETLNSGIREDVGVYLTPDHPRPTAAELKSFIQDGDASWAQIRGEYHNKSNTGCSTILTIGDSSLRPAYESGRCVMWPPYPQSDFIISLSPDESVLMPLDNDPAGTSTGRRIGGAWSVKDGKVITFPGSELADMNTSFYLVNPELIVAYNHEVGGSNTLTAYRPNEK